MSTNKLGLEILNINLEFFFNYTTECVDSINALYIKFFRPRGISLKFILFYYKFENKYTVHIKLENELQIMKIIVTMANFSLYLSTYKFSHAFGFKSPQLSYLTIVAFSWPITYKDMAFIDYQAMDMWPSLLVECDISGLYR